MRWNAINGQLCRSIAIVLSLLGCGALYADVKVEIFIDSDKGYDAGMVFVGQVGENEFVLPLEDISAGAHIISFRTSDESGWSSTVTRTFCVFEAEGADGAEYFIDADPGNGMGKQLTITENGSISFVVPTQSLSVGAHTLTVRLRSGGTWTASMTRTFVVTPNSFVFEWFFDEDPGVGMANQEEASEGDNVFMLSTAELTPGAHLFSSRTCDAAKRWSTTDVKPLYVTEKIDGLAGAEYFVDEDPGEGYGEEVALSDGGEGAFVINTENLSEGVHQLTLRGVDFSGKWHIVFSAPFEVRVESGVSVIEWKNAFKVYREGELIRLSSENPEDGSEVKVVNLKGIVLHTSLWRDGESTKTIQVNSGERQVIVMVTSPDGYRFTKLVQ